MEDDDSLSNSSIYNSDNPPSARSVRKMVKRQKSNAEEVMAAVTKALEKISSRYNDSLEKKEKVDEDRNLIEMIYTMIQSISDGMSKAMLRTELQQKIIQVKYSGYQAVLSSSVPVQ